jgi:hypothetical protein
VKAHRELQLLLQTLSPVSSGGACLASHFNGFPGKLLFSLIGGFLSSTANLGTLMAKQIASVENLN